VIDAIFSKTDKKSPQHEGLAGCCSGGRGNNTPPDR